MIFNMAYDLFGSCVAGQTEAKFENSCWSNGFSMDISARFRQLHTTVKSKLGYAQTDKMLI